MHRRPEQISDTVLMVRPAAFGYNPETASSNVFQTGAKLDPISVHNQALDEFELFVKALKGVGVRVLVVEDTPTPQKTDAVFPNNWISFHEDGRVVLYPMLSENRRLERENPILSSLGEYEISSTVNLIPFEEDGKYLEGTGSMVLDRENGIVYACHSPRTSPEVAAKFAEAFDYHLVMFDAVDSTEKSIYHTNVLMALGEAFVVVCLETVRDQVQLKQLQHLFAETGKEIVEINLAQMKRFAGNMLQVRNDGGERFVVLSARAYGALDPSQIEALERHGKLIPIDIPTIEQCGGGSVRCMMAEVFLPRSNK
ncbi:MAG: hypothetical protein KF784_11425 [Fimbriimonadaceae bacterium]|nr:hypothetical protein [Fimbriimonadaceae bacterium]